MSVVYGYEPSPRDDPLVQVITKAVELGIAVMTPERSIILKTFPFLLKLPDWCWGSSIKRDAQASTHYMNEMKNLPFQYAKQHMADLFLGQSSMVAENLKRIEKQDEVSKPMLETALKSAATTAMIGK
ncbi:hypothetical protein AZE42_05836 [Rhizopogon vesiculosus]|uniref:Uncharacterized protein n=1 Tax=Rhizopogon vesiculosus TaxID=180088 RepID=A0A1J8QM03_9AGAM|nr:hypothetical protein AZE42_05836 [Rhizopogon vesiculosus]